MLNVTRGERSTGRRSTYNYKDNCMSFGHVCFGAHGKRFDSTVRRNTLQKSVSQNFQESEVPSPNDELFYVFPNDDFREQRSDQSFERTSKDIQQFDIYPLSSFVDQWHWKPDQKMKLALQLVKGKLIDEGDRRKDVRHHKEKSEDKALKHLYRWKANIEKDGTNADKVAFITKYVLQKFEEARERRSIVHDMNSRALEIDLPEFKASKYWIWKFKNVHGIVSRKITTFRTPFMLENINNKQDIAKSFVSNVRSNIPTIRVENADESSFSTLKYILDEH
ncbi:uncharacterized protein LOC105833689 isoform X3 [Monomorium pharaonis]|uniref:uncharacterized protein LOC105833689 isoform X3 n=1 Tax=Monomorium pharaonis TaxID=307658 RepID=UPI001747AC1B|nr:uncharacterized protein LOC105833689 isoform X3 [Monomorium pharaonis]